MVTIKLLVYPISLGGKDLLMQILKDNLLIFSIVVWINNLVIVSMGGQRLDTNYLIGLLVIYIPISLMHLFSIFKGK